MDGNRAKTVEPVYAAPSAPEESKDETAARDDGWEPVAYPVAEGARAIKPVPSAPRDRTGAVTLLSGCLSGVAVGSYLSLTTATSSTTSSASFLFGLLAESSSLVSATPLIATMGPVGVATAVTAAALLGAGTAYSFCSVTAEE